MKVFRKDRHRQDRAPSVRTPWAVLTVLTVLAAAVGSASTLGVEQLTARAHGGVLSYAASAQGTANALNLSYRNLSSAPGQTQTVNVVINDAIVQAIRKATPSVVGVLNMQNQPNAAGTGYTLQEAAVGSGVIFSRDGYIVTNNHVVQGANQVRVVIDQKKQVVAQVVGTDPYTDLAVLKVPANDITAANVATFGDSATLQVGEPAIAIGNPAGMQFADTATSGIISATARTMPVIDEGTGQTLGEEKVLQTDAAINPGNSGGPLLNIEGQVIGINSSKIAAQDFSGMGFAIPINQVKTIVNEILTTGHGLHAGIGIEGDSLSDLPSYYQPNVPVNYGFWIYKATSAQAKAAGLEKDDVIVAVNGQKVTGITSLQNILSEFKPGDVVTLTIYRGGKELNLKDTLINLPPPQIQGNGPGPVVN